MDINQLISAYTDAETALLKAFDFEQDWHVLPIDDMRKYVWTLSDHSVEWAEYEDDLGTGKVYTGDVWHNIIKITPTHTAIAVDTQCDGNIFFCIFDNSKRR